jgi:predicted Zn-dependent protease
MKKALGLLYNKDERMIVRSALQEGDFASLAFPGNAEDAWNELKKPGRLDLVVLDERFEIERAVSGRASAGSSSLHLTEFIDELRSSGRYSPEGIICLILNEGRGDEQALVYAELGVDLTIRRPLGAKDLREKVEAAMFSLYDASPQLRLQRSLRQAFESERFAEASEGFRRLFEAKPEDLHAGIFYAKSEIALGRIENAVAVLERVDALHPGSLLTKRHLIELYGESGQPEKQLDKALRLFALQPATRHFETALVLADTLRQRSGQAVGFRRVHELVEATDSPRAPEWRLRALSEFGKRVRSAEDAAAFFSALERHPEALPSLAEAISALFATADAETSDWEPALRRRAAAHALDVDAGHPRALRLFVELSLAVGDAESVWKRIDRAKLERRGSAELYAAWARLALLSDQLKDASDAIHAGRRLAPNDERWDSLAQQWRDKKGV